MHVPREPRNRRVLRDQGYRSVPRRAREGQHVPKEIDLVDGGPYANYNWELLFHVPLTIAVHLSKNQRFAEAQRWFPLHLRPDEHRHIDRPAGALLEVPALPPADRRPADRRPPRAAQQAERRLHASRAADRKPRSSKATPQFGASRSSRTRSPERGRSRTSTRSS